MPIRLQLVLGAVRIGRPCSLCCVRARDCPLSGRKLMREKLWRDFFSDPSQWCDHRSEKVNPKYPDFKHKTTQQALWIIDNLTPPWVESELAAMPRGVLQSYSFSWNVRLKRHVKAGDNRIVLDLFQQMQREGIIADKFTFLPVLNACSNLHSLHEGRRVHEQIMLSGCDSDVYVATCLVDMYAKCGSIDDARSVFNKMRKRDVVSWNAMIGGYVISEQGLKAMDLFQKMQQEGVEPNTVAFMGMLNACASVGALEEGRRVHEQIIQKRCDSDVVVANCLIDMYAKCGSSKDAWSVFNKMQGRDVVSWNAMIGGYVKSEQGLKAIELFWKMQQEGLEPNVVTFVGVLNACASVVALQEGKNVHEKIVQRGCESDVYVATSLVDMYAKCGSIEEAWGLFNKMPERDVVSWNAMIRGYVKSEQGLRAIELFRQMKQDRVEPDATTFAAVLNACAIVAALEEGRLVHEEIIQSGCGSDVYVATGLVNMYAKCGSIEDAWTVFNKMQEHNVVSCSAMIGGYARHGHSKKAIGLFKQIVKEGVKLDDITFICLLSACSHGGLVREGLRYFKSMTYCYDILPTTEHYVCLVDLLGRAGRLGEAMEMTKRVTMDRNASVWMSLLSSCRTYGNIEMAKWVAQHYLELDPEDTSSRVLMSNIYAAAEKYRNAAISKDRLESTC